MTAAELLVWAPRTVAGHADRLVTASLLPRPDAVVRARAMFDSLLPDGIATAGHRLMTVWTDHDGPSAAVGHVWLRLAGADAFLVDLGLAVEARGRGLGTSAMLATEDLARAAGSPRLSLSVFRHSTAARALYDRLGYAVTDRTVVVDLGGQPPAPAAAPSSIRLRDMSVLELDALRPHTPAPVDRLLPDGPASRGHRLWTAYDARDPTTPLGRAWLQLHQRSDGMHATVVHGEVLEPRRGRGLGRPWAAAVLARTRAEGVRSVTATVPAGAATEAVLGGLRHRAAAESRSRSLAPTPGRGMPGERAPGR